MASARITVIGLWHLGCVVSTALAHLGHNVVGTDFDSETVRRLQQGQPPIYEPDLTEMMARQTRDARLSFAGSCAEALAGADYVFITFDTPVDDNDQSDLGPIERALDTIARHARGQIEIVIMSQIPVGTCRRLAQRLRQQAPALRFHLAYQPENLRLGEALKAFLQADLIVVGAEDEAAASHVLELYQGIESPHVTMSWDSAEMVKHALNTFLATSISFVNELSNLAEVAGPDMRDVVRALRLDRRIGKHAFLSPGPGFSGGTLARDVQTLRGLGRQYGLPTPQLDATLAVNAGRLTGIVEKIRRLCGEGKGRRVGLLGLTYKPGTSTLRRSNSLALARLLLSEGSKVRAFDPQVREPQPETEGIEICSDPYEAAREADAVVVMTPWAEFKDLDFTRLSACMRRPVLLDPHNCLDDRKARTAGLRYCGTGIPEASRAAHEVAP